MNGSITRTFNTYRLAINRLFVERGEPAMEVVEEWDEELPGILGDRAARKLAVTRNGGRLRNGCTVSYTLVKSVTYQLPAEQFKQLATPVEVVVHNESE